MVGYMYIFHEGGANFMETIFALTDWVHLMFLQANIKGSSTRNDLGLGLGIWELLWFAHDQMNVLYTDTYIQKYVKYTSCFIYTYIYIYLLTPPPRAYQNDAKDAKSLCFQPSPMLIFHLILPQNWKGTTYRDLKSKQAGLEAFAILVPIMSRSD